LTRLLHRIGPICSGTNSNPVRTAAELTGALDQILKKAASSLPQAAAFRVPSARSGLTQSPFNSPQPEKVRQTAAPIYLGDYTAVTKTVHGQIIYVDTRDISLTPQILLDG
jgi:hypothetical protein